MILNEIKVILDGIMVVFGELKVLLDEINVPDGAKVILYETKFVSEETWYLNLEEKNCFTTNYNHSRSGPNRR